MFLKDEEYRLPDEPKYKMDILENWLESTYERSEDRDQRIKKQDLYGKVKAYFEFLGKESPPPHTIGRAVKKVFGNLPEIKIKDHQNEDKSLKDPRIYYFGNLKKKRSADDEDVSS